MERGWFLNTLSRSEEMDRLNCTKQMNDAKGVLIVRDGDRC